MAVHTGQTGLAYMGYADSATPMTTEAMTINAGRTIAYVTAPAKRAWDPDTALTINYTGGAYTGVATVYRAGGFITFSPALDGGITLTVTGAYIPVACIGVCKGYTLDASWNAEDATVFPHCEGNTDDGWQRNASTSRTMTGSIDLLVDDADTSPVRMALIGDGDDVVGGKILFLELGNSATSGYSIFVLGWPSYSTQASPTALNTETISFVVGDDPPYINYTETVARGY